MSPNSKLLRRRKLRFLRTANHSSEAAFGGTSADLGFEQRHWLHDAEGHARRASAGDSRRTGSEVGGGGEGTGEESPPAGRLTDETDYFRFADHPEGDQAS